MRYFILFSILILISNMLFSQDIIRKTDGSEINCKIIEATKSEVKYKISDNNEPKSINSDEIKEIQFSNGTVKPYTTSTVDYELKRHMFSIEPIDIIAFQILHLGYQFQASKKLAIYIPFRYKLRGDFWGLSTDFRYVLNNSEPSKIYVGPLDLGDGTVDYFIGPSLQGVSSKKDGFYSYIKATAGVSLQQLWGFNASLFIGFGPGYNFADSASDFDFNLNLTFGYRFNKRIKKTY